MAARGSGAASCVRIDRQLQQNDGERARRLAVQDICNYHSFSAYRPLGDLLEDSSLRRDLEVSEAVVANWMIVLLVVISVAILALCVMAAMIPQKYAPRRNHSDLASVIEKKDKLELEDGRLRLQNEWRSTFIQAVPGLAVLLGAALAFNQLVDQAESSSKTLELSRETLELARDGQVSDRYTRATGQLGQLGKDKKETRTGGAYALEQVVRQSPDNYRIPVTEVLMAFLHHQANRGEGSFNGEKSNAESGPGCNAIVERLGTRNPDVQAAVAALGRWAKQKYDPLLDLSRIDISRADLAGARLTDANFFRTDLHKANLFRADLRRVYKKGVDEAANLKSTNLCGADLREAKLAGVDLSTAFIDGGTKFEGATSDQCTEWPEWFDWRRKGVVCKASAYTENEAQGCLSDGHKARACEE